MMDAVYTLNHLLISKTEHEEQRVKASKTGLSVAEIEPDAKTVRYWVEQVGSPYGWPDREQYTLEAIGELIKTQGTRLFMLQQEGCPIGYCLIHDETESNLRAHFTKAGHNIPPDARITRIEGFGLAGKHTNKDFGNFYLQKMFEVLFDHGDADYVYLTSRSTNHPGVIPFYLNNGMHIIDKEHKAEDRPAHLIPAPIKAYA